MFKLIFKVILILFLVQITIQPIFAQKQNSAQRYEAKIEKILEEKQIIISGQKQIYQKLQLKINNGKLLGRTIIIENGKIPLSYVPLYKINDSVYVEKINAPSEKEVFAITDYARSTPLYILFIFFVILTIFIGRIRGALSLLGMVISFATIFFYILPNILSGKDPVLIAISASLFFIPITFYLSHGINGKTTSAVIGTVITLIITGFMASVFTDLVHLSGFSSDEASFVQTFTHGILNMKGLLLAGILIGTLGVLDDITISQSAVVYKLKETDNSLHFGEIWSKSMDIGKDHIASMVNTLVLVYTGASLPLLILFLNSTVSFGDAINYELLAEEIVRTLVGSIGLILAVPITTFISSYLVEFRKTKFIFLK